MPEQFHVHIKESEQGEWFELYLNGHLVNAGHHTDWRDGEALLKIVGVKVTKEEVDDSEAEMPPENYDDPWAKPPTFEDDDGDSGPVWPSWWSTRHPLARRYRNEA